MAPVVVNGAQCMCTMGTSPCSLVVLPTSLVQANKQPLATIFDQTPANLPTFGMCMSPANPAVAAATAAAMGVLTPQPCVPAVAAPWAPPATPLVGGKPVLNLLGKAVCMWAGTISIVSPGSAQEMAT